MSVVVRTPEGKDRLIAKGAPESVFPKCEAPTLDGKLLPMDHQHIEDLKKEYDLLVRRRLSRARYRYEGHGAAGHRGGRCDTLR